MALQTTRLQGIAAREANLEDAASSSLFNRTTPGVTEGLAPGTELRAALARPNRLRTTTLAMSQVLSQRNAAIRQQAQLALQERGQMFQEQRADIQDQRYLDQLARQQAQDTESARRFDLQYGLESDAATLRNLQDKQNLESGALSLQRNRKLYEQYGPTLAPEKTGTITPLTKGTAGYYTRSAISSLGIPESEIYGEEGLTQRGSDFLDVMDVLASRNPQAQESDLVAQAARIVGLRNYDQAIKDIDDELTALGSDKENAPRVTELQNQRRSLERLRTRRAQESGQLPPQEEDGQLPREYVRDKVNKAVASFQSRDPAQRDLAFNVIDRMNQSGNLTDEDKSSLYDSVLQAKGGRAGQDDAELLKGAYSGASQQAVFAEIKKMYANFKTPKITGRGKPNIEEGPGVISSGTMTRPVKKQYPSEADVLSSIAEQLPSRSIEQAKIIYQNILLDLMKAKKFDDLFEEGQAASSESQALTNLLSRYGIQ